MKQAQQIRNRIARATNDEKGVALIIALICLFVISTLAVGVLYSTQSEIWTTASYTATTQARYIAEAGVQQGMNWVFTNTPAVMNGTASFNLNCVPVQYPASANCTVSSNSPVIFATSGFPSGNQYADTGATANSTLDSNFTSYFASAVTATPFTSFAGGNGNAKFDVAVQLIAATQVSSGYWQTRWKIVSQGSLNTIGSQTSSNIGSSTAATSPRARVQVVEVVDNFVTSSGGSGSSAAPTYGAAIVALGTGCNSIKMNGSQNINSYVGVAGTLNTNPTASNTGGNIINFGNLFINGSNSVYGSVYSPFYNVGATGTYGVSANGSYSANGGAACSTGSGGTEYTVNENGSGGVGCTASSCTQKTYAMPTPTPSYPTPQMPSGVSANTNSCSYNGSATQSLSSTTEPSGTGWSGCTAVGSGATLNMGDVSFNGSSTINMAAGTYNMDTFVINGSESLVLPSSGNVVLNLMSTAGAGTQVLNLNGSAVANNGGVPSDFTIVYAGAGTLNINGSENMFVSVYAPNAVVNINGSAGIYGSIVGNTVNLNGSGPVMYDSSLNGTNWNITPVASASPTYTQGPIHIDEFSWSSF